MAEAKVGRFFHSFHANGDFLWQGVVTRKTSDGAFGVQLFSWLDGGDSSEREVSASEMDAWAFYVSAEEMRRAWARATGGPSWPGFCPPAAESRSQSSGAKLSSKRLRRVGR